MKRIGKLMPEILKQTNLEAAFESVMVGNRKETLEGKWIFPKKFSVLSRIKEEIKRGHLRLGKWIERTVRDGDGNKKRVIQVFSLLDRIKVTAVMIPVDKALHKKYIQTTACGIKGRGTQGLKRKIEEDLRKPGSTIKYWYKIDIHRFFETIPQDILCDTVDKTFKEQEVREILKQLSTILPGSRGVPVGLRSSQSLGNLLLSTHLDHYFKDRIGVKWYYRYCDDILFGATSKEELWKYYQVLHERLNYLGLSVNPGERVFPVTEGLDFLGYVIYPSHTKIRKSIKESYRKKMKRAKTKNEFDSALLHFSCMAKHGNCKNLIEKLKEIWQNK